MGRAEEEEVLRWHQPMSQAQTDRLTDEKGQTERQRERRGQQPGRAHLLLAIKLGLKWARALKEAAAAAAANSAAGVVVAALLRQLPVQTALLCSAVLSLVALALSAATRSLPYVAATQTHWTAERSYSRLALAQGACSLSAANGFAL